MSQSLTVRSVRHRARSNALGDERVEAAAEETVTAPSQTGDRSVSRDCLTARPAQGCAEHTAKRARAPRLFEPSLTRATRAKHPAAAVRSTLVAASCPADRSEASLGGQVPRRKFDFNRLRVALGATTV
jgi:hypothetical protein